MTVFDVARTLPDIPALRRRCQALALLEVLLNPEPESRYYSYAPAGRPGEEWASMDNGSGDNFTIVFSSAGVFIRGFDHESSLSPAANDDEVWPGLVDTVPEVFSGYLDEPSFSFDGVFEATVCLWRQPDDGHWQVGDVELPDDPNADGADWMFQALVDPGTASYHGFAQDYYERSVDQDAVAQIFALATLTDALVQRLNPDLTVAAVTGDLKMIGYPVAGG